MIGRNQELLTAEQEGLIGGRNAQAQLRPGTRTETLKLHPVGSTDRRLVSATAPYTAIQLMTP